MTALPVDSMSMWGEGGAMALAPVPESPFEIVHASVAAFVRRWEAGFAVIGEETHPHCWEISACADDETIEDVELGSAWRGLLYEEHFGMWEAFLHRYQNPGVRT